MWTRGEGGSAVAVRYTYIPILLTLLYVSVPELLRTRLKPGRIWVVYPSRIRCRSIPDFFAGTNLYKEFTYEPPTANNNHHHNHGRRWQKWPPSASTACQCIGKSVVGTTVGAMP